jgi:hypothetical protein
VSHAETMPWARPPVRIETKATLLWWVQETVVFDCLQCLDERQAAMEAEPSARVSMPLDIEAIAAHPVQGAVAG